MPKLDLKGISLKALWSPLQEWRLLLRCAALPALLYLFLITGCQFMFPAALSYTLPGQGTFFLWSFLETGPMLLFEWRWLSALWHGEARGSTGVPMPSTWWRYIALFGMLEILYQTILAGPDLVRMGLFDTLPNGRAAESSVNLAFAFIEMTVIAGYVWVFARLLVWNAAVIDRRSIIGPVPIWQLTRGHAWRITCLVFLMTLPLVAVNWLIEWLVAELSIGELPYLPMLYDLPMTIYGYAVFGAASLLIYSHLTQHHIDRSVDVF